MMAQQISDSDRALFAKLADYLIPAYGKMPSASSVEVQGDLLDKVMDARPDLLEGFKRGLAACQSGEPSAALNALLRADAAAFQALSLTASGGYYMADEVRKQLGYPGQEGGAYDPHETPEYLTNGMIERVVRRGLLYRSTPR